MSTVGNDLLNAPESHHSIGITFTLTATHGAFFGTG